MKLLRRMFAVTIVVLLVMATYVKPSYHDEAYRQSLTDLGLFELKEKGLQLSEPLTRAQATTLLSKFTGVVGEAGENEHPRPDDDWIDKNEFSYGVLKALGYDKTDLNNTTAYTTLYSKGILKNNELTAALGNKLSMNDAIYILYHALFAQTKDGATTLAESLYKNGVFTEQQVRKTKNQKLYLAVFTNFTSIPVQHNTQNQKPTTTPTNRTDGITHLYTPMPTTNGHAIQATDIPIAPISVNTENVSTLNQIYEIISAKATTLEYTFTMQGKPGVDLSKLVAQIDLSLVPGVNNINYSYIPGESTDSPGKLVLVLVYKDYYSVLRAVQNPSLVPKLNDEERLLLSKATSILTTQIKSDMTDYDKEFALHNYLILNCIYDTGVNGNVATTSYTAYGALVKGVSVCQGYAESFALLLNMAGVPCVTVEGTGRNELHEWNKVEIGGDWYNVDVTWDDPVPDTPSILHYQYFNVTDTYLQQDHSWLASENPYPVANATTYNYFVLNDLVANDYTDFKRIVTAQLQNDNTTTKTDVGVYVSDTAKPYDLNFVYRLGFKKVNYIKPSGTSGEFIVIVN